MSDAHELWSGQVHTRNAALKESREGREQKRAAAVQRAKEPSDLDVLSRDFHTVAAREVKPMKGFQAPRAIPNHFQSEIDRLPEGHEIRRARDEGRIRYEVRSGRWVVDGVEAAPAAQSDGTGHLPASMFAGSPTAKRNRERIR
jgi:hypothetical protein